MEHRVKAAVYRYQRRNFNQILAIDELANIVAVSVLLQDSTGRYLIVHRGNKVAIHLEILQRPAQAVCLN